MHVRDYATQYSFLFALRQRSPQTARQLGLSEAQASELLRQGLVAQTEEGLSLTLSGVLRIRR